MISKPDQASPTELLSNHYLTTGFFSTVAVMQVPEADTRKYGIVEPGRILAIVEPTNMASFEPNEYGIVEPTNMAIVEPDEYGIVEPDEYGIVEPEKTEQYRVGSYVSGGVTSLKSPARAQTSSRWALPGRYVFQCRVISLP